MTSSTNQMPKLLSKEDTMKVATVKGLGRRLVITDFDMPIPGKNEVLVKVNAASVNPKDWKLNVPLYPLLPKKYALGDDMAGIIADKGPGVTGFEIGDEVFGMSMRFQFGSCAEYAIIPADCIARKPKTISMGEAAAVPLAALTGLQALDLAKVGPGSKVLIVGASGGVGLFTVQIAKAMGAHVTAVCSGRNFELVRSIGADAVIDYTKGDYTKAKDDFNAVIDVTSYLSLRKCASLMAPGATFITTCGNGPAIFSNYRDRLLYWNKKSKSVVVDSNQKDLDRLTAMIDKGDVKIILDSEYPIEHIKEAYERSKTGRARGKIVIHVA